MGLTLTRPVVSWVEEYGDMFAIRCDQCEYWWRDIAGNVIVFRGRAQAEIVKGRHDRHEHA